MDYFATFHTHFGAVSFERKLKKMELFPQMMPVPRSISASCGVGIRFSCDIPLRDLTSEDLYQIFSIENGKFTLMYEGE